MKFSPTWTAAEASAAATADAEWSVERRMRRLFETASALRRRRVYVDAKRRGIDRLAWPGLVSSSLASSMDDLRLDSDAAATVRVSARRHPSPAGAVPSYSEVRCVRSPFC